MWRCCELWLIHELIADETAYDIVDVSKLSLSKKTKL